MFIGENGRIYIARTSGQLPRKIGSMGKYVEMDIRVFQPWQTGERYAFL